MIWRRCDSLERYKRFCQNNGLILVNDSNNTSQVMLRIRGHSVNRAVSFGCALFSSSPHMMKTDFCIQSKRGVQWLVSLLLRHRTGCLAARQVHAQLLSNGSASHSDMALWNALLRVYSQGEYPEESLMVFKHLQSLFQDSHSFLDSFTYSYVLKGCANLDHGVPGSVIHSLTFKVGFGFHVYVQTALLNMYIVCGALVEANKIFNETPEKNLVTWNAMITGLAKWGELSAACSLFGEMPTPTVVSWTGIIDGYTRINKPRKAIIFFRDMVALENMKPSEITLLALLPAISNLGVVEHCQVIHCYSEKRGFTFYFIQVSNSIIHVYAKCGCIESALRVFDELSEERRNLVTWTSIISGFAMHGMANEAVEKFKTMDKLCLKPNSVTFLSILNACSHGGLVDEGLKFFTIMLHDCQLLPNIKHYGCVIDMLGRAGRLEKAEQMAFEIPAEINTVVIWRTLLGACSFHGNAEVAERVTRKILEMEKGYGGDYVILSNIFTGVGKFDDALRVRMLMDEQCGSKVVGCSLV